MKLRTTNALSTHVPFYSIYRQSQDGFSTFFSYHPKLSLTISMTLNRGGCAETTPHCTTSTALVNEKVGILPKSLLCNELRRARSGRHLSPFTETVYVAYHLSVFPSL